MVTIVLSLNFNIAWRQIHIPILTCQCRDGIGIGPNRILSPAMLMNQNTQSDTDSDSEGLPSGNNCVEISHCQQTDSDSNPNSPVKEWDWNRDWNPNLFLLNES